MGVANTQEDQQQMAQHQLLRVSKTARILDVSNSQAYNLINRGEIEAIRVGRSLRVSLQTLNEYIARKTAEGLG